MNEHSARDFCGEKQWPLMHAYAVAYTPDKAKDYKAYVHSLTSLFPCDTCKKKWAINLKKLPIDSYLQNNRTLFLWTYLQHDIVNKDTGKRSPPFKETRAYWFGKIGVECKECNLN